MLLSACILLVTIFSLFLSIFVISSCLYTGNTPRSKNLALPPSTWSHHRTGAIVGPGERAVAVVWARCREPGSGGAGAAVDGTAAGGTVVEDSRLADAP